MKKPIVIAWLLLVFSILHLPCFSQNKEIRKDTMTVGQKDEAIDFADQLISLGDELKKNNEEKNKAQLKFNQAKLEYETAETNADNYYNSYKGHCDGTDWSQPCCTDCVEKNNTLQNLISIKDTKLNEYNQKYTQLVQVNAKSNQLESQIKELKDKLETLKDRFDNGSGCGSPPDEFSTPEYASNYWQCIWDKSRIYGKYVDDYGNVVDVSDVTVQDRLNKEQKIQQLLEQNKAQRKPPAAKSKVPPPPPPSPDNPPTISSQLGELIDAIIGKHQ